MRVHRVVTRVSTAIAVLGFAIGARAEHNAKADFSPYAGKDHSDGAGVIFEIQSFCLFPCLSS